MAPHRGLGACLAATLTRYGGSALKVERFEAAVSRAVLLQAVLRAEATGLPFLIVSPAGHSARPILPG